MQCQSCGSDVRKDMKQCPACGEEVTSAFTTSLPRQATHTGRIDYSVAVSELNSEVRAKDPSAESKLNGKQMEAPPFPVKPVMPPLMSAIGRDRENTGEVSRRELTPPEAPSSDLLRTSGISCRRCRHELKVGAKFCSICGTSVEPSALSKALAWAKLMLKNGLHSARAALAESALPKSTVILLGAASLFILIAMLQYLIPSDVDAGSSSQLIYHLRSIEFLLVALISVVASLAINKR